MTNIDVGITPVGYTSPQNVSDGRTVRDINVPTNVNKTPNSVHINQPNVNENTETVQVELREKINQTFMCNEAEAYYKLGIHYPVIEQHRWSRKKCIDHIISLLNHQLSLKDTEHAKAIELAKTKTINDICTIACDNQRDAWINGEAFMMAVSKYKQKEEIENARN